MAQEIDLEAKMQTQTEERHAQEAAEAMKRIKEGQHWSDWRAVGVCLLDGRMAAQRRSGASKPIGSAYNKAFGEWMNTHPWARELDKPTLNHALWVGENIASIERWRDTLPENVRRRINHPTTMKRHYEKANTAPKSEPDEEGEGKPETRAQKLEREIEAQATKIAKLEAQLKRSEDHDEFMENDPVDLANIYFRRNKTRASKLWTALGHLLNPKMRSAKLPKRMTKKMTLTELSTGAVD
jgi:septal ring factor EnvC (AmiA/AmiB activator)